MTELKKKARMEMKVMKKDEEEEEEEEEEEDDSELFHMPI